jgi:hypothetical protein
MGRQIGGEIAEGLMTLARGSGWRPAVHARVSAGALYTSGQTLEKCLETCHFLPLFEPYGVTSLRRRAIGRSFRAKNMQPETW